MRTPVRKLLATAALVLCGTLGLQMSAQATVLKFTYTGTSAFAGTSTSDTASGTLTTGASNPAGCFYTPCVAVTGITGTYNGAAITGLLPSGTYYKTSGLFGRPGNDNLLYYPATQSFLGQPTYLDRYGLGFSTASDYINIYFGLGGYGDLYGPSLSSADLRSLGTFTVTQVSTAVPEPSSLGILGLGLGLLGGLIWTRRRRGSYA